VGGGFHRALSMHLTAPVQANVTGVIDFERSKARLALSVSKEPVLNILPSLSIPELYKDVVVILIFDIIVLFLSEINPFT